MKYFVILGSLKSESTKIILKLGQMAFLYFFVFLDFQAVPRQSGRTFLAKNFLAMFEERSRFFRVDQMGEFLRYDFKVEGA